MVLHPHFKAAPHEIAELISLYDVIPEDSDSKKSPADLIENAEERIFVKKVARLASLSLSSSPSAPEIKELIISIKENNEREDWKPLLNILTKFAANMSNTTPFSLTDQRKISTPGIPVPRSSPLQKSGFMLGEVL
jgi:hypothetical protein